MEAVVRPCQQLQRGRTLAGAEGGTTRRRCPMNAQLQRGRTLAGAEGRRDRNAIQHALVASTGPHPCGRGRRCRPCPSSRTPARFNGAAPLRARKAGAIYPSGSTGTKLQRGRTLAGAEGKTRKSWACWMPGLQRGRTLAGAEGLAAEVVAHPPITLQRGRTLAGAEGIDAEVLADKAREASTGPHPCGRGRRFSFRPARRFSRCFNGAAPLRARKGFSSILK